MRLLVISLLCLFLSACWQQTEVISIEKNGDMKWLVIAKPDWEFTTVKSARSDLNYYVGRMESAGWTVKSKGKVVEGKNVTVALIGNLQKVGKETDFYKIHSVNQSQAKVEFLCPMIDDYRINRKIKFKDGSRPAITCGAGVATFRY